MKISKYLIPALLSPLMLVGCADYDDWGYDVEKPNTIAGYEYLNDYAPLKEYVNSNASATFKLGAGVMEDEFNGKGPLFRLAAHNFNEIVAGNAMKMASVVNDKGEMEFGNVQAFVTNAEEAGVSVYGHTLAWHAQQPVKWLNKLIEGKEVPVQEGGNPSIVYDNGEGGANSWDKQAIVTLLTPMETGKTYIFSAKIKADEGGDIQLVPIWTTSPNLNQWGGSNDVQYLAVYTLGDSFSECTWEFQAAFPIDKIQFFMGKIKGKIYFDDVTCKEKGSDSEMVPNGSFDENDISAWSANWNGPTFKIEGVAAGPATWWTNQLQNGDCEGEDAGELVGREKGKADFTTPTEGVGHNGSKCIVVHSIDNPANNYDTQFFVYTPNHQWVAGEKYQLKMWVRADKPASISTQAHDKPGQYIYWSMLGDIPVTTEWTEVVKEGVISESQAVNGDKTLSMHSIAFNLNDLAEANTYYFDDVEFSIEESGNKIPLTDEEKKDTLTWAMDRWIKGMMEACEGKVKAWDVVNEAIGQGAVDAEGVYALQHAPEGGSDTDFFWQDYLGDLDYVRTAVKLARQYGPEDVKLFVNDYNLESDWDQNGKVKSLVEWIKRWEADGVTKIDGIGTQMHIWCYSNEQLQEAKKAAIVTMFKEMAKTGKLVRVSELDMGYTNGTTGNEEANMVSTDDMTEAQHKQMAELYKFVIEAYFENVPASQQWGICQWCITDSPSNSGWRKNQPTGLWDKNYYRKHTYAGFADGLAGK